MPLSGREAHTPAPGWTAFAGLLVALLTAVGLLAVGAGVPLLVSASPAEGVAADLPDVPPRAGAYASSGLARAPVAQASASCTVERIIDGDTFVCESGERVRLILVNTPEMSDEPLGRMARTFLRDLMPPGTEVTLETDVGERDRYGRLLAYVRLPDGRMVNRVLARAGYAQVMVVPPNVRHVETIRAAVDSARAEEAGLWGRSPGLRGGPSALPGASGTDRAPGTRQPPGGSCHPAYPGVCIPPPPPDLDCPDVGRRRFRVRAPDPHRFDGDGDGVGCEGP